MVLKTTLAHPVALQSEPKPRDSGLPSGVLVQEDVHRHLGYLRSGVQQRKSFYRLCFFSGKPLTHSNNDSWHGCVVRVQLNLSFNPITKPVTKI